MAITLSFSRSEYTERTENTEVRTVSRRPPSIVWIGTSRGGARLSDRRPGIKLRTLHAKNNPTATAHDLGTQRHDRRTTRRTSTHQLRRTTVARTRRSRTSSAILPPTSVLAIALPATLPISANICTHVQPSDSLRLCTRRLCRPPVLLQTHTGASKRASASCCAATLYVPRAYSVISCGAVRREGVRKLKKGLRREVPASFVATDLTSSSGTNLRPWIESWMAALAWP